MPAEPPASPLSETAILELLRELGSPFGKQVVVEARPAGDGEPRGRAGPDVLVRVAWSGEEFAFAAEAKSSNAPRLLDDAVRQARRWASDLGLRPMVVVPFLAETRIERLLEEGVSGLDLCGNGLVVVPGRWLLRRTGQPNRYPETRPARFAYRGATSMVPRVFLRKREFASVGQIQREVQAAGGPVALSTVSKALARMAEDLIIERSADRIALLQPDKLLDALAENYAPPRPDRVLRAQMSEPLAELFRLAGAPAKPPQERSAPRLVLSGASSQDRYAAGMRADTPTLYCDDLAELRARIGDAWQPTERFADLTVVETRDPTPYFDARADDAGVVFSSPVQAYLELSAAGEKRDREIAGQIRARILRDLGT